jgi:uncharacterized protein YggU (UPF0235/DUF167 family)
MFVVYQKNTFVGKKQLAHMHILTYASRRLKYVITNYMSLYQVRVTTNTKQDAIRAKDDVLIVSVRAAAERNQANVAVLRLVKKFLHAKRIELVSGHHKVHKVVRVA